MATLLSKDELREEALSYLRAKIHSIIKNQKSVKMDKLTVQNLNYQLSICLIHYLNNDFEAELQTKLMKMTKLSEEKAKIKKEYLLTKESLEKQKELALQSNEETKKKFDDLEKYLYYMQERQEMNKNFLKENGGTEISITSLLASSANARKGGVLNTAADLSKFYSFYHSVAENQKRIIRETKEKSKKMFIQEIKKQSAAQFDKHGIEEQNQTIDQKRKKLKEMEDVYQTTIATINKHLHLNINTSYESSANFIEIKKSVKKALSEKTQRRKQRIINEIKMQIPDVEIDNYNDINKAIHEYIEAALLEKEAECQRILRRSSRREHKLRLKLAETLQEMRELHYQVNDSSSLIDEIDILKSEWQQQSTSLDRKMQILSQRMSKSSGSSFQ